MDNMFHKILINKESILYLILSANQNNSDEQFLLGVIYYKSKHISSDINKSSHHLTLSANKNDLNTKYFLGEIYFTDKYVSLDFIKSISLFNSFSKSK